MGQGLETQIKEYLAQNLLFSDDGFQYSDDTSLLEQGIIDSMGVMELVMYVGSTFGVQVEPTEITPDNFDSVAKLASYIRRKKGEAS